MTDTPDARPAPYPPTVVATGGGAGTAAFAIGIVLVALGLVQQLLSVSIPLWVGGLAGYSQVALIFGAFTFVTAAIAVAGVVTGAVGIQPSRPRGRLAAAAGLAVSAAHLLGAVVALIAPVVIGLLA